MSNQSNSGSGLGILGIVFITLKLTGYIDWSWWWVLLPFYGGLVLVVVGFILYLLYIVYFKKGR